MTRRLCMLLACLALLASPGCHQAGHHEDAQAADASADQAYEEAMLAAQKAYMEAESFEEKLAISRDFLERYPETEDTADVIGQVSRDAFEAEQPEAAYELVDWTLAKVEDPDVAFQIKSKLVDLHARTGDKERLRALVAEIVAERELRYRDLYPIIEAAVEAEDWELAVAQSDASLAFATPAHYKEDSPDVSDADAEKYGTRRVAYSLAFKGWAQYNLGRTEDAFASFRQAKDHTDFDILGVDPTPLHRYWGTALLRQGEAEKAMELLATEALFGNGSEALEAYREAYAACNDGDGGFDEHFWDLRMQKARKMPDFALPNYDGETVQFADFKGDVVLLAFWFPT